MRRRRKTDHGFDSLVITTEDGTVFRCSVAAIGRETEPRWALIDPSGHQYMGPPVTSDRSPENVRRAVSEWWGAQRESQSPPAS